MNHKVKNSIAYLFGAIAQNAAILGLTTSTTFLLVQLGLYSGIYVSLIGQYKGTNILIKILISGLAAWASIILILVVEAIIVSNK